MNRAPNTFNGRSMGQTLKRVASGFTLVELLVVVAIIGLLISILLPALTRARAAANMTVCKSNMQQIANATRMYANDNRDHYPDTWTVGLCVYRRGYMELTPGDPGALPEVYGLPALYHMLGYLKGERVWICPSAMDRFQSYKNTYIWALLTWPTASQPRSPSTWTSRQRNDVANRAAFWVNENLVNIPPTTGINYSYPSQPVDSTLKGQLLPHPYQTRITSSAFDIRRGAMNVVFMDGSVGVAVYTPTGTAKLSGG